jgi:hypothetical protein
MKMHTPAAALAWELWRKHRTRVIIIVGLLLAFALVYPMVCAMAGFSPGNPNDWDVISNKMMALGRVESFRHVFGFFYLLFIVDGPVSTMFLTLFLVMWMFTGIEIDPKTKKGRFFFERMFTLPVSTSFLFWWLWLGGMAAVAALHGAWVYFVGMPHIAMFSGFQNCFGWMTLLALGQAIVWALPAWPIIRAVVLITVPCVFLGAALQPDVIESPFFLPPLFLISAVLARVGLQRMRHGLWQGWAWKWRLPIMTSRAELRGPKRFASPAQAQLWFEWRRFARRLCFYAAALAVVLLTVPLVSVVAGFGPLSHETMSKFFGWLFAMPLVFHFCVVVSFDRKDAPFLMIRPLSSGAMAMAVLKAAAISAVFSCVVAFVASCVIKFGAVEQSVSAGHTFWTLVVWGLIFLLGLIFLTWRFVAINFCFVMPGGKWLPVVPALILLTVPAGEALSGLAGHDAYWESFRRVVPGLLAGLVALKFLLAFVAFRVSLKRRLLAPSSFVGYMIIWTLLVIALLVPTVILFHDKEWIVPALLGIVLLVPLARIGFCPITLERSRHE